jgi:hypothetical protein
MRPNPEAVEQLQLPGRRYGLMIERRLGLTLRTDGLRTKGMMIQGDSSRLIRRCSGGGDGDRITIGRGRRVRWEDGPRLGCGFESPAAIHAPFLAPGQRTYRAAPRAPTRRCRPGVHRPCGPHPPTPVFASHTRLATVARRSSRASEAAISARRRSSSSADLSGPAGSSPTSNRTSTELSSQKRRQAARPARTCGKRVPPVSLGPARRAGGRPNSDRWCGGGGGCQNRAPYRRPA